MRLQALTLDEVCTSLSILDDVGIVKVEGKRDMLKRTVSTHPPTHTPPPHTHTQARARVRFVMTEAVAIEFIFAGHCSATCSCIAGEISRR